MFGAVPVIIEFADLKAEVIRLATERPDFNYRAQRAEGDDIGGCSYAGQSIGEYHKGEGCIFGQALQKLGLSREDVRFLDHTTIRGVLRARGGIGTYLRIPNWDDTDMEWAAAVQLGQDTGALWSEALKYGDEAVASYLRRS